MEAKKHIYVTVNGREIEYQAISLDALRLSWNGIEKQYRERGEPIDPPTYEFETGSGAKITEPHDATTIDTPEEHEKWDKHQDALGRMQYDKSLMQMKYILEDGIPSIQLPEDDNWTEKHKRRMIDIPTDPVKLREFYITSEVLKSNADMAGIVAAVMLLSQQGKVEEAALETALDSFLAFMGRKAVSRIINRQKQVEAQQ
jgi:hypothetical protein